MGDDRPLSIQRIVQRPDHAIRVDRRLRGLQTRLPFALSFRLELTDLALDLVTATRFRQSPRDLFDQLAQDELRIADHRLVNLVVLVDVARIAGDLDHPLALGNRRGESASGKAAANPKHQV